MLSDHLEFTGLVVVASAAVTGVETVLSDACDICDTLNSGSFFMSPSILFPLSGTEASEFFSFRKSLVSHASHPSHREEEAPPSVLDASTPSDSHLNTNGLSDTVTMWLCLRNRSAMGRSLKLSLNLNFSPTKYFTRPFLSQADLITSSNRMANGDSRRM